MTATSIVVGSTVFLWMAIYIVCDGKCLIAAMRQLYKHRLNKSPYHVTAVLLPKIVAIFFWTYYVPHEPPSEAPMADALAWLAHHSAVSAAALCGSCGFSLLALTISKHFRTAPKNRSYLVLPLKIIAIILAIGCAGSIFFIPVAIVGWWLWDWDLGGFFQLPAFFLLCCLLIAGWGQRAERQLHKDLPDESDEFVLYLRSFDEEAQPFVRLTYDEEKSLGIAAPPTRFYSSSGSREPHNLEEFLGSATAALLRPLYALGDPADFLPPQGATRIYTDDTSWVSNFLRLSYQATCIFIQPAMSENLLMELRLLTENGLHTKTFILMSPEVDATIPALRLQERSRAAKWNGFFNGLKEVGYRLPAQMPSRGSVLAIRGDRQLIVIGTGAHNPHDFVMPIKKWLTSTLDIQSALPADGGNASTGR